MQLFTIGHSTRTLDEFAALLKENAIELLADIRRYPGSRRYPHFSNEALALSMPQNGIKYIHMPALGGRRQAAAASPNTFWRNEQFRGYADHMATDEFRLAVDALLAGQVRACAMCAEAVPWRCHRNLLADDLVRRGVEVFHILGRGAVERHAMNPNAREEGNHLVYPSPGALQFRLT